MSASLLPCKTIMAQGDLPGTPKILECLQGADTIGYIIREAQALRLAESPDG